MYENYEDEIVTQRSPTDGGQQRGGSDATPYYTKKYENYWNSGAGKGEVRGGSTYPDSGRKICCHLKKTYLTNDMIKKILFFSIQIQPSLTITTRTSTTTITAAAAAIPKTMTNSNSEEEADRRTTTPSGSEEETAAASQHPRTRD